MELAGQMDRALALLQPQPNKEICPPMMCQLGNRKRKVTWIMCDACDQWYHVGCVGLTANKANSLDTWHCSFVYRVCLYFSILCFCASVVCYIMYFTIENHW